MPNTPWPPCSRSTTSSGEVHSYTVVPSLNSVMPARSRMPRRRRCSTATRMFCSETPGVEQPLDDLEDQDVLERVEPLAARARRAADRGHDQPGARPVVELAVGDPHDLAGGRAAEADQLVRHPVEPGVEQRVGEELALPRSLGYPTHGRPRGHVGRRGCHRSPPTRGGPARSPRRIGCHVARSSLTVSALPHAVNAARRHRPPGNGRVDAAAPAAGIEGDRR